ncbi:MAG: metallophosphoesterase family protein [Thermoleophilia bacterium]|nr:metallophosphoesterase family protein [Thermoleophilia bacterium]
MRIAVISDIHANLHALEAVLAAVGREHVDALWCLGDVVGYGPHPSRCCARVAAHADVVLAGNHDLGVAGLLDVGAFSPEAAIAARWTAATLDQDALRWLSSLEPEAETPPAHLCHASPRDPIWEYVLAPATVAAALAAATRPLLLVGHSHAALAFELGLQPRDAPGAWAVSGGPAAHDAPTVVEPLRGGLAPAGTEISLADGPRRLLNPGSVGQPRDGDPRAAWLLLDLGERSACFRRESYDIARTQADIATAGLPASLADRLAHGL